MHNTESPRVDDAGIEPRLQAGAVAPRVTLAQLEAAIAHEAYLFPTETLTICVLTLANGFTVTGESACASPANFDAQIGRDLARVKAVEKIWPLEGYLLRDKLHKKSQLVLSIAQACHEVNRAYCAALGDLSQKPWDEAPQWQKDSAMKGVLLHLDNPDAGPEASHRSWMAEKVATGWKYGPMKDEAKKEHHCMVSFEELPREQQAKDFIFRAVVHAMAQAL